MKTELTIEQRRAIRAPFLGIRICASRGRTDHPRVITRSTPVEIVPGDSQPKIEGSGYWKTNFSNGRGFSRTMYTPSTLRIEVGEAWIKANA